MIRIRIYYIPNPVDESFETLNVFKNKTFSRDLFFAMRSWCSSWNFEKRKFDVRENFINELMDLLPNVKFDVYGMEEKQPIWADQYLKSIANSKMALNLSQGDPVKYYSSDRFPKWLEMVC